MTMKAGLLISIVLVIIALIVSGFMILRTDNEDQLEDGEIQASPEFLDNSGQFLQTAPYVSPSEDDDTIIQETLSSAALSPQAVSSLSASIISVDESGFTPADVTVPVGTKVVFVNNGQASHWPASAIHPTHKSYPGSDIKKCSTEEALTIFDACRGLTTGQEFSFTFNEAGTWQYHDHLQPSVFGTIIVTK